MIINKNKLKQMAQDELALRMSKNIDQEFDKSPKDSIELNGLKDKAQFYQQIQDSQNGNKIDQTQDSTKQIVRSKQSLMIHNLWQKNQKNETQWKTKEKEEYLSKHQPDQMHKRRKNQKKVRKMRDQFILMLVRSLLPEGNTKPLQTIFLQKEKQCLQIQRMTSAEQESLRELESGQKYEQNLMKYEQNLLQDAEKNGNIVKDQQRSLRMGQKVTQQENKNDERRQNQLNSYDQENVAQFNHEADVVYGSEEYQFQMNVNSLSDHGVKKKHLVQVEGLEASQKKEEQQIIVDSIKILVDGIPVNKTKNKVLEDNQQDQNFSQQQLGKAQKQTIIVDSDEIGQNKKEGVSSEEVTPVKSLTPDISFAGLQTVFKEKNSRQQHLGQVVTDSVKEVQSELPSINGLEIEKLQKNLNQNNLISGLSSVNQHKMVYSGVMKNLRQSLESCPSSVSCQLQGSKVEKDHQELSEAEQIITASDIKYEVTRQTPLKGDPMFLTKSIQQNKVGQLKFSEIGCVGKEKQGQYLECFRSRNLYSSLLNNIPHISLQNKYHEQFSLNNEQKHNHDHSSIASFNNHSFSNHSNPIPYSYYHHTPSRVPVNRVTFNQSANLYPQAKQNINMRCEEGQNSIDAKHTYYLKTQHREPFQKSSIPSKMYHSTIFNIMGGHTDLLTPQNTVTNTNRPTQDAINPAKDKRNHSQGSIRHRQGSSYQKATNCYHPINAQMQQKYITHGCANQTHKSTIFGASHHHEQQPNNDRKGNILTLKPKQGRAKKEEKVISLGKHRSNSANSKYNQKQVQETIYANRRELGYNYAEELHKIRRNVENNKVAHHHAFQNTSGSPDCILKTNPSNKSLYGPSFSFTTPQKDQKYLETQMFKDALPVSCHSLNKSHSGLRQSDNVSKIPSSQPRYIFTEHDAGNLKANESLPVNSFNNIQDVFISPTPKGYNRQDCKYQYSIEPAKEASIFVYPHPSKIMTPVSNIKQQLKRNRDKLGLQTQSTIFINRKK